MRVSELANELGKTSKEVLDIIKQKDSSAALFAASSVSKDQENMVRNAVSQKKEGKTEPAKKKLTAVFRPQNAQQQIKRPVPKQQPKPQQAPAKAEETKPVQAAEVKPQVQEASAPAAESRPAQAERGDFQGRSQNGYQGRDNRGERPQGGYQNRDGRNGSYQGRDNNRGERPQGGYQNRDGRPQGGFQNRDRNQAALAPVSEKIRIRTIQAEMAAETTAVHLETETTVHLLLIPRSRPSQAAPVRQTRTLIRMTVLTRETEKKTERRKHQRQERELSSCHSLRKKRLRLRMLRPLPFQSA